MILVECQNSYICDLVVKKLKFLESLVAESKERWITHAMTVTRTSGFLKKKQYKFTREEAERAFSSRRFEYFSPEERIHDAVYDSFRVCWDLTKECELFGDIQDNTIMIQSNILEFLKSKNSRLVSGLDLFLIR